MSDTNQQKRGDEVAAGHVRLFEQTGYQISQTLHRGESISVHRARGPAGDVVLKWLDTPYPTSAQRAAFRNEFEILKQLDHPGIVRGLDMKEVGNGLVLVLEKVEGAPLDEVFRDGPLPIKEFFSTATQIVDVLRAIHDAGFIHKDLNPANVLYDHNTRRIRIIDFGITTAVQLQRPTARQASLLQGTIAYMSPEQTGRMNRTVDYRTDLYSLGGTFYAMLTGRPPFESDDAVEVIHSHLARVPQRPSELVGMPEVLADIVMKLLSKDAEDRYQTAAGLLYDLEHCERQLRETYSVNNFTLATHDRSSRFQMPQRIYGREDEIKLLFDGFERVCAGTTGVLLVTGASGVGKSSLVKEVRRPLMRERGSFIEGKFDQYNRDRPYSALIDAFEDLAQQLIVEGEHDRWKRRLTVSLGANLGVITAMIPGLRQIVGDVAPVEEIGAVEARNRFTFAFQQFLWVIASREHPIVLFLDDLQWADQASLDLLRVLLTDSQGKYLYFIGCYRDTEVGPDHALLPVFEASQLANRVERLILEPLDEKTIRKMLLDTFVVRSDGANQLADILVKKTGGNPFFLNEFLRALHESGHLVFDEKLGEWTWNAALIAAMETTENVSDLTAARLKRLPEDAMEPLKLAACVGNTCSERRLATLMQVDRADLRRRLESAFKEGVLLLAEEVDVGESKYVFSHDRVRQSAYARMSEPEQRAMHLRIGRQMLKASQPVNGSLHAFEILDQLNTGRQLIEDRDEQDTLVGLNLDACRRAKSSAAFGPALRYVQIAMELAAGDDVRHERPELARNLCLERGECEFLNGHHEEAEKYLGQVIENADSALDAFPAYLVLITANNARGQFSTSLRIGIEALGSLGIVFPSESEGIGQATQDELGRIKEHLRTRDIDSLIDLPEMSDPELIAAMQLLVAMTSTAYIGGPELYPLIVAKQINLSIENGNAPSSAIAYSSFGVLNSPGGLSDLDTSYAFGELSLRMLERQGIRENAVNINFVFGTFISHWRKHLAESVTYLDRGFSAALDAGHFEYVRYAATFEAFYKVLQWADLAKAGSDIASRLRTLNKIGLDNAAGAFRLANQLAATLSGGPETSSAEIHELLGPEFDEYAAEEEWKQQNDFLSLSCLAISRIIIASLYRKDTDALALIEAAKPFLVASTGTFLLAEYVFCRALVLTATLDECSAEERTARHEQIAQDLETLSLWAKKSPQNFEYRELIIRAELGARRDDQGAPPFVETIKLYETAGQKARENGFLLHEGMIYERAAVYCDRMKLQRLTSSFLQDGIYAFDRLGAEPKVALLRTKLEKMGRSTGARSTQGATPVDSTQVGANLERESFFRAGQAISAAIRMEDLLGELIKIVVEFAGAERCAVIRTDDGEFRAVAQGGAGEVGVEIGEVPLEKIDWLHPAVVRVAMQTRSHVVVDDVRAEGPFKDLPEVAEAKSRSILCLPIVERGKIGHLIYLSNNLSPGAFTTDRVESLKLLSGHVAVSIANAELYENLEEKVAERTNQLELRNELIRREFGRYMSDDVAESLLDDPQGRSLGGEQRVVTILMADLRGFTALADRLEAPDVVRLINNFLGEMTELILRYHGTINDFIGDEILAIFGAPVSRDDDAERAVACALEMQCAMERVNERNVKFGLPVVGMGIGLHTGNVVVGNVGSENRVKYGVVGQAVNLASRIESYSVGGQILASRRTIESVGWGIRTGRELDVHPKGAPEPITILEILELKGRYEARLPEKSDRMMRCDSSLDVEFTVLDGKDSTGDPKSAYLIALSEQGGGLLQASQDLPLYSNLRMHISRTSGARPLSNLYAKVVSKTQDETYEIRFTSISEELMALIEEVLEQAPSEVQ